jgi:hypothetical protein
MTTHATSVWARLVAATLTMLVPLSASPAAAQALSATSAYVTEAPNNPLWLALATPDGRWAIQLADGCTAITAAMNVSVIGRVDDPEVQLLSTGGESCGLAARVRMGTTPCVQNPLGLCDVRNS